MGLLDDAIREHLELKRRHGASEDELQRQEEEALGPARRDVAPAEQAGDDAELELEAADDAVPDALEDEADLYEQEDEPLGAETVRREGESDSAAAPVTPFEAHDEAEADDDLEGVPEPDAMPPSPAPFDAESAFEEFGREEDEPEEEDQPERDEPEGKEADVLEDTPDFLQETPEHDRLWFEQKPPRDFDFD
jgi:hypothetical protein